LADFSRHFFDYIETHNLKNVFVDICPWYWLYEWNSKFWTNKIVDFKKWTHAELLRQIIKRYARYLIFWTDAPYTYELNEEYRYSVDASYRENLELLQLIEDADNYSIISHWNAIQFLWSQYQKV
jgi:broad specificity phosphatase PhoE